MKVGEITHGKLKLNVFSKDIVKKSVQFKEADSSCVVKYSGDYIIYGESNLHNIEASFEFDVDDDIIDITLHSSNNFNVNDRFIEFIKLPEILDELRMIIRRHIGIKFRSIYMVSNKSVDPNNINRPVADRIHYTAKKIADKIRHLAITTIGVDNFIHDNSVAGDVRVLSITHTDTDAMICDMCIRSLFQNVITRTWDYDDSIEKLLAHLADKDEFDFVFITDISIKEAAGDLVNILYDTNRVIHIDHHSSNFILSEAYDSIIPPTNIRYGDLRNGKFIEKHPVAAQFTGVVRHLPITVIRSYRSYGDNGIVKTNQVMYDDSMPSAGLLTFLVIEKVREMLSMYIFRDFSNYPEFINTEPSISDNYNDSIPALVMAMSRYDTFEFEDRTIPAINRTIMNKIDDVGVAGTAQAILDAFEHWKPQPDANYEDEYVLVSMRFMGAIEIKPVPGFPQSKMVYTTIDKLTETGMTEKMIRGYISLIARTYLRKHPEIDIVCWEDENSGSLRSINTSKVTAVQVATNIDPLGGGHVHAAGYSVKTKREWEELQNE